MRKKLLAMMVMVSILSLGACTEDPTMDELTNNVELDQTGDPDDDDVTPPGGN